MEIVLSIVALVSVVLFQAVVHYSFARKKQKNNEKLLSGWTDTTSSKDKNPGTPFLVPGRASSMVSCMEPKKKEDIDETLDGDEPEEFYELLSQTGTEMARVSRKLEEIGHRNAQCTHHYPSYIELACP
jgi:hypothetical protein